MNDIVWEEAAENDMGITSIAFSELGKITSDLRIGRIVGYNGILKGDTVEYKGKEYTVVMVSRLGHLGLSETGKLPYTVTALPNDVTQRKEGSL